LEDASCVGPTLASIVIILLLYDDYIVLMVKSPYDLGKKLIFVNTDMGMTVNTEKIKVMIIKSKRIIYDTFVYDNTSLEEVPS
jgi:hypothetical protein